jgi:hypothetical protein
VATDATALDRVAELSHINIKAAPLRGTAPGVSGGLGLGRPAHRTPGHMPAEHTDQHWLLVAAGTALSHLPRLIAETGPVTERLPRA